jgi:hypothetical protein
MTIIFPFHKSDKAYPICFIINPGWHYDIMLSLCVTNKTTAAFYALAFVGLSRRDVLFTRLLPEDKYLSFVILPQAAPAAFCLTTCNLE